MSPRPRLAICPPLLRRQRLIHTRIGLPPLLPSTPSIASSSNNTSSSTPSTLPTTLNGWIRSVRKQKTVSFAVISDGTNVGGTQVVLPKGFEQGLTIGCSTSLEGEWVKSPKSDKPDEFKVSKVSWIGDSDAEKYPIPNTKQGIPLPILRHNAHLRARKDSMAAVLRTRSEMSWAMSDYFRNEGFLKVEAPIITSSDCEGGGEVFKVVDATPPPSQSTSASTPSSASDQFSPSATQPSTTTSEPSRYLSVSSQLHLEAIASSHPRVYALSPCFRAEKSDTARHLQEFWMLEAELAFLSSRPSEALEQVMEVCEGAVRAIAQHVRSMPEFEYFASKSSTSNDSIDLRQRTERLLSTEGPYPRITYTEAVETLSKASKDTQFMYEPKWGNSLQTEHEKYLAEQVYKGPVFVTDYPTPLKPFYMLENSPSSTESSSKERSTTACFDLLVPDLGELAGGSLRTHSLEDLQERIDRDPALRTKKDEYEWYLDLRRYGTTRHGGFGIGWERLVGLLTGVGNVRECIAFPRAGEGSRF